MPSTTVSLFHPGEQLRDDAGWLPLEVAYTHGHHSTVAVLTSLEPEVDESNDIEKTTKMSLVDGFFEMDFKYPLVIWNIRCCEIETK